MLAWLLEIETFLAERRAQIVEPDGTFVELGKKWLSYPRWITRLNEIIHHTVGGQVCPAIRIPAPREWLRAYLYPSCRAASRLRAPGPSLETLTKTAPARTGHLRVGSLENLVGSNERNLEVIPGTRVPLDEHVVRDQTQSHARSPEGCPRLRIVINVTNQRPLHPYLYTSVPHTSNRFVGNGRI